MVKPSGKIGKSIPLTTAVGAVARSVVSLTGISERRSVSPPSTTQTL